MATVTITDESTVTTISKYAAQKGISNPEAAAKLIATAKGRINAVRKYAAEHAAEPKAKKAKKAPKGKPSVAKAPKARKPKAATAPAPEVAVDPNA
jgi:hypothetical protein